MNWGLVILCALGLAACNGGDKPSPPKPPVTIADPMAYISGTVNDRKQTVSDPIRTRRFDFGHHQATDSFLLDSTHAVVTWDYPVHGQYAPLVEGDGGEQYVLEGDTVRIEGTRHGTTGLTAWFSGPRCGGTGWVVFRTDVTEQWREMVARLGTAFDPSTCKAGDFALTRYTMRVVNFPVLGEREAIVSEHYDAATVAGSKAVERFFFVSGLGRVVWQSLGTHEQPAPELTTRCPDFGWKTAGHLPLRDCRISVHVETTDGAITGAQLWSLGK
jgi:hypothetical protein